MASDKVNPRFKKPRPTYFFRQWRKKRGLTQEELAHEIGVSIPTISQLETGKQGFTGDTLEALAAALHVEPWELLTRNPEADSSIWIVLEKMAKAKPEQQEQVARVVSEMLRTGTDG
jgi:transcriptional regulator with XRE-family HTH domain